MLVTESLAILKENMNQYLSTVIHGSCNINQDVRTKARTVTKTEFSNPLWYLKVINSRNKLHFFFKHDVLYVLSWDEKKMKSNAQCGFVCTLYINTSCYTIYFSYS